MVKIPAALSILNSSGASPGTTKKVAAVIACASCSRASCSVTSHSSDRRYGPLLYTDGRVTAVSVYTENIQCQYSQQ